MCMCAVHTCMFFTCGFCYVVGCVHLQIVDSFPCKHASTPISMSYKLRHVPHLLTAPPPPPSPLPPSTGQPPPSHVCHARGAQGLDLLAGVHGGFKVSWQVPLLLPHRQHTPGVSSHQEPLHLDQSRHHHSQYHCGEALGRPGELEIVISLPRFVFFLLSNFSSVFLFPCFRSKSLVGPIPVQSGELRIVNHTCGEEATVKYHAYSYFSREQQRKVGHLAQILSI